MPRIFYVVLFVILTLAPFPVIWVCQALFNVGQPQQVSKTYSGTSHYYHNSHPFYGGFFYYGDRGRGGWLGRSYRSYSSQGSSFSGSSRSYSGGSSSFSGGSFGAFGK